MQKANLHLSLQHPHQHLHLHRTLYQQRRALMKTLYHKIEYIHQNPVRRGLVEKATDWIWSSARFYAGYSNVPIRMDPLPPLDG